MTLLLYQANILKVKNKIVEGKTWADGKQLLYMLSAADTDKTCNKSK